MTNEEIYWSPQPGPQAEAFLCPADELFAGGERGGGKGSPYHAEIITPFGVKTFADVKSGMQICNPDGTVAKILQVFELGERDIYTIIFDDGAKAEVTSDHLWLYRFRPTSLKAERKYLHSDEECPWRVGTTEYLKSKLFRGIRIPLTKPVAFTVSMGNRKSDIDPYLLGLILGDGHIGKKGTVELSTSDFEIAQYLHKSGFTLDNVNPLFRFRTTQSHPLAKRLQTSRLWGKLAQNKFIPEEYKLGTKEMRWALVQGLCDSDGYADNRGHVQFTSVSKQLAEDVQFLVRSLGGKATITNKVGKYSLGDGSTKDCKRVYMLYIQMLDKSKCFRLSRKKNRCIDKEWNGGCAPLTRKIVSIKKTGREKARCIRVDHPNGLYLTDDFIVTHNTQLIIGREVSGAREHGIHWNGIIFRKKYKDFKEIRIDFDRLIAQGLPARRVGGENQVNFVKHENGAVTTLAQAGSLSAVEDWQGNAFSAVSIDEAQQFPYLTSMMSLLKGCMRSAYGIQPKMLLTGNPGGPGAGQIKEMFIPVEYGGNEENPPEGRVHMVEIEQEDGSVATVSRVFIQLPLVENRILLDGDPGYLNRLRSIADGVLRAAWLDGRWDVHVGQAFNFGRHNILDREIWPIPEFSPIYMTFDWGWGAPFSVQWWWVDGEGRIYLFYEWYGCQKNMPNKGIHLTDPEIAEGILEREQKMGILGRVKKRLAGPDCFREKPNYKGRGQGAATADEFRSYCKRPDVIAKYGEKVELNLMKGDATRETKLRQFRTRLRQPHPDTLPMLVVYPRCKDFIRTVPSIVVDEVNPEEIEDLQEDHGFDAAALLCQEFPMGTSDDEIRTILETAKKRRARGKLDTASRVALEEWEWTLEQIQQEGQEYEWLWD